MAAPSADSPVFLSYSRHDYYFAESLALHLLREGVPAWLDVKNLIPGVFWERDLFASLEAAKCVIFVASADSMKSPNCRQERDRAVSLGKRIIVARFRGAKLDDELCQCEVVDFRGAFVPALQELLARLNSNPPASAPKASRRALPRVPSWVLAVLLFSLVPMLVELTLFDWSGGPSSPILNALMILLVAFGLCWLMSLSFLQRKMGMTRLAASLLLLAVILAMPFVEYVLHGTAGLADEATGIAQAITHHPVFTIFVVVLPLIGLLLIVLVRPYDLLRWTPTGKAWHWYRRQCTRRVFAQDALIPPPQARPFFLMHDVGDSSAGEFIRQRLTQVGWTQSLASSGATSVLLLTNRTTRNWLLQQQSQLTSDVLTIVATTICLPAQVEWLWKREWTDLRGWKMERLQSPAALPQVPEAVTTPHFPRVVKFANHLVCCLAGLVATLAIMAAPGAFASQNNSYSPQMAITFTGFGVAVLCSEMARRLLRRTITEAWFNRGVWSGWCGGIVLLAYVMRWGSMPTFWSRGATAILFLMLFPVILLQIRKRLNFWFPDAIAKSARALPTLAGNTKSWRTFWCFCLYLVLWTSVFSSAPGISAFFS